MANASLQAVMAACLSGYAEHHPLSPHQWQVCHHILDCRTAALGGFALECDQCGETPLLYHACREIGDRPRFPRESPAQAANKTDNA